MRDNTYNATDIANFLVFLMSDSQEDLTNMKLNKILYYAQGHYLQKTGKPLFDDKIEAWTHGPVVKSVYQEYKEYSDNPISKYNEDRLDVIDDEIKSYLVDVARVYGRYTAATLRNMTHKPKSPWAGTREGAEISIESIRQYFIENEDEIKPLEISFTEDDFVGHRDENGVLVLPKEWQDEEV